MNNLTMYVFQSILYRPLFLITYCYVSGSLLTDWNSPGFQLNKFSTNIFIWFS